MLQFLLVSLIISGSLYFPRVIAEFVIYGHFSFNRNCIRSLDIKISNVRNEVPIIQIRKPGGKN